MNPLILVNARHACPGGVPDLIPVGGSPVLLDWQAAQALEALMEELDGWQSIVPVSGWRSFEEQTGIYQSSLAENGPAFTRKYVALPGHSEHQTGLAIDLGLRGPEIDFIRPDFPYEGVCQRFRERAAELSPASPTSPGTSAMWARPTPERWSTGGWSLRSIWYDRLAEKLF